MSNLWGLRMFFRLSIVLIALFIGIFSAQSYALEQTSFLVLADIHFDPFTACYDKTERPCPMIKKLLAASAHEWSAILRAEDTKAPVYREDTNYTLLTSSLLAAKHAAEAQHVQYVLVLGDFVGHDFRKFYKKYSLDGSRIGYQAFVKKLLIFLNNEISDTFPSLDVYSLIGNNDAYLGDYYSNPHGQFYKDTGMLWSGLIKNKLNRAEMQREFPIAGYYAVDVPAQGVMRLIMMNTVLFSNKGRGKNLEQASRQEFDWLHDELMMAKQKNQKVIIGMHIPEGIDVYSSLRIKLFNLVEFWRPDATERFQNELEQFAPEISAIFAGHLHTDWFQVRRFDNFVEIPILGTPSISPIFGNNPGFKIYSYGTETGQLDDFVTYYYPVNDNNRSWKMEYDFSKIYKPNCQECPVATGMNALQQTGVLANFYKIFYAVKTTSQPITTKWNPYYWCAIREVKRAGYSKCVA